MRSFSSSRRVLGLLIVLTLVVSACSNASPLVDEANGTVDSSNGDSSDSDEPTTTIDNAGDSGDASAGNGDVLGDPGIGSSGNPSLAGLTFAEFGPIDISGFARGLDSCANIDPARFSELLGRPLVADPVLDRANVEPSSPDRTCVLFAAENPSIDLVRINATDDVATWVRWVNDNEQLSPADIGLFKAANDPASVSYGEGGDFGFGTLEVVGDGARLLIEARQWDSGIEYAPLPLENLAAMASIAAAQLTSPGPASGSMALQSCDDLDVDEWSALLNDELEQFRASSFDGALTCTAVARSGNRVQVLVQELELAQLAAEKAVVLRTSYGDALREPESIEVDNADIAWEIDRIFDDDQSGSRQSVLQQVVGTKGPVFARVSIRESTREDRTTLAALTNALGAVLDGGSLSANEEPPEVVVDDQPVSATVAQFLDSGAQVEVAPLTRGLTACADLDLSSFEKITGISLSAVDGIVGLTPPAEDTTTAATTPRTNVECSIVHADDDSRVEMRVSAASTAADQAAWRNFAKINGLVAIEGIDDRAFWNGDTEEETAETLILYVEEGDARLLVELTRHEWTPDIDLFWVSQAFARELFSPAD